MPSHNHAQLNNDDIGAGSGGNPDMAAGNHYAGQTGFAGGDTPHNIMQPYFVIHYIIKI